MQLDSLGACDGSTNGQLAALPAGGTTPFTYAWSAGGADSLLTLSADGSYTLTLTDANGCTAMHDTSMLYPCDVPINLRQMDIQDSTVRLSWDTVCGAVKYRVAYKVHAGGDWVILYKHENKGSYTLTGLDPEVKYRWNIKADCDASGWSAASPYLIFTTLSGPCNVPTNTTEETIGASNVKLVWDGQPLVWKYRIRYREVGTTDWTVIVKDSIWEHHWLNGLITGASYEWQMRSVCTVNGSGTGWSSLRTFTMASSSKFNEEFLPAEALAELVQVYPNPNNGQFTLNIQGLSQPVDVRVMDVAGKVIYHRAEVAAGRWQIDLGDRAAGMYFVQLSGTNVRHVERIVIQ